MNNSIRNITLVGLLVAMSIVLSRVASIRIPFAGVEGVRIGFGKLPIFLASLMLGPLYGGLVGAVADFLGYIIQPIGPYVPHFTIISALCGVIPIMVLRIIKGKEDHIINITISVGIAVIVTELFLIPYSLNLIFGIPWPVLVVPRLISVPLTIAIYSYLIHVFIRRKVLQIVH
ncbi:MAG: folate family ECF transporter S component [Candidatus Atribacteria bacterium]|nr:folate family ECF transporter S component [Candidatus Atribacteria bacterium]